MEPKERILLKAHELFRRFGFRRVTMDEIAVKTGMSKKTIYQSFATKDEIVDAVVGEILQKNQDRCLVNLSEAQNAVHENFLNIDLLQELTDEMNPVVYEDLEKYFPSVYEKVFRHKYEFIRQKIQENLERGIREGLYRPEVNVDILTKFRVETLFIPMNSEVFPYSKYNLIDVEYQIMMNYLYGLCTPTGHQLIKEYSEERLKHH